MVICLERDADLHMAQLLPLPLTVSCFSKIQIGFTFLVPAPGSRVVVPDNGPLKAIKRMCVRVCVYSVPMPWCTGCRRVGSLVASVQWECLVSD